jgi:hypothetical protein
MQGWGNNLYHALVEVGSRLALLKHLVLDSSVDGDGGSAATTFVLLVPPGQTVAKVLGLLGLRDSYYFERDQGRQQQQRRRLHIHEYTWEPGTRLHADTMVWADWDDVAAEAEGAVPASRFVPAATALNLLSASVLAPISGGSGVDGGGSIVLASRDGSRRGAVLGETMLLAALRQAFPGREVVHFVGAGMPMRDQVLTFRGAQAVVGVHGAGLSNIVFCTPGTAVVEVPLNPFAEGPYFRAIARARGLRYARTDAPNAAAAAGGAGGSVVGGISLRYVGRRLVLNSLKVDRIVRMVAAFLRPLQTLDEL